MRLLFTYGTLMRGRCRQRYLAGQRFVGEACTAPRYALVDCGEYPGLIETTGDDATCVRGELYEVTDACLAVLDQVEGVAEGLFGRNAVALVGEIESAVAYFYARPTLNLGRLGACWPDQR